MPRGRKPKQAAENKELTKGYITINNKLRLRVETDCLTLEEATGINNESGEIIYGNFKYFTSWNSVLDYLIRKFTAERIVKKQIDSFQEAKKEILAAIENAMMSANNEIKKIIKKFDV